MTGERDVVLLCVGRDDPGAPDHAAFPSVILTVSPFVILRPQAEESASSVFVRNRNTPSAACGGSSLKEGAKDGSTDSSLRSE